PIILFGESYWRKIVNFEALAEEGMISAADLRLFEFVETAEDGWASLVRRGLRAHGTAPSVER
ncbi:MAG: LOG family protein, partial [Hyphomicrobium sp.]|nr:LOG family protein [Hyphomicrobium sp.]